MNSWKVYTIATGLPEAVIASVNALLKDGWKLHGELQIDCMDRRMFVARAMTCDMIVCPWCLGRKTMADECCKFCNGTGETVKDS